MDIDYFANENQSFWEEISNNCLMMTLNPLVRRPPPNRKSCRLLFHPQTSEYGAAFHVPSLPNFKSTMRKNLAKSCGCFVIRIGLLGLLKVKGERERNFGEQGGSFEHGNNGPAGCQNSKLETCQKTTFSRNTPSRQFLWDHGVVR